MEMNEYICYPLSEDPKRWVIPGDYPRYFLFYYEPYESLGGMDDYRGSFATIEEARAKPTREFIAEIAVFDGSELKVIERRNPKGEWYKAND